MNLKKLTQPDPGLEAVRVKALGLVESLNNDAEIEELIRRTTRIHAAFLFHSPKTLQPLLRAIGETHNSAVDSGWQLFGDKLGLDVSILKVINNNQFNNEDPVYNTLLHYVQYEDATIERILTTLKEMGRLDVISRTKDVLLELCDVILSHEQELMRSSTVVRGHNAIQSGGDENEVSNALIRPGLIPEAPFIMKNLQATPLISSLLLQETVARRTNVICSESFTRALAAEAYQHASPLSLLSSPLTSPVPVVPRQTYGKKVMLTFAADGANAASTVAETFRQVRNNLPRIGVLVLGEQRRYLEVDPFNFIHAAFHKVDYVIPILTTGYLSSIMGKSEGIGGSECIDSNYVAYIYRLMMLDYTQNGCRNDKVRCLIPDEQMEQVSTHLMLAGPLFRAWEKISLVDKLAERLLNSEA